MQNRFDFEQTDTSFWNEETKSKLQKNLNDVSLIKPIKEQKISKEALVLQGLALFGTLAVFAFTKDSPSFNKQLVFMATAFSGSLAFLRGLKKKEMLKETLTAISIFSFFGEQTLQTKNISEKLDIIKQSQPILTPDYINVYKVSKRASLLSGIALAGGYYLDKISLGGSLLAGVAILTACNLYDLMQAKNSIKRISSALPKGVTLPFLKEENQRG
ncbi:MAG: hypothetical protein J6V53_03060 [Alphaproteobacteria bacterium]|nr:hypothetical protein [Alphaproteobacteria bacterium]